MRKSFYERIPECVLDQMIYDGLPELWAEDSYFLPVPQRDDEIDLYRACLQGLR